jgi:hypothetical protein
MQPICVHKNNHKTRSQESFETAKNGNHNMDPRSTVHLRRYLCTTDHAKSEEATPEPEIADEVKPEVDVDICVMVQVCPKFLFFVMVLVCRKFRLILWPVENLDILYKLSPRSYLPKCTYVKVSYAFLDKKLMMF